MCNVTLKQGTLLTRIKNVTPLNVIKFKFNNITMWDKVRTHGDMIKSGLISNTEK